MLNECKKNLRKARDELGKAITDGDDGAITKLAERYIQASNDYTEAVRTAALITSSAKSHLTDTDR